MLGIRRVTTNILVLSVSESTSESPKVQRWKTENVILLYNAAFELSHIALWR
jgi:hypothetical protein